MKKALSIILILSLVLASATSVFAITHTSLSETINEPQDVKIVVIPFDENNNVRYKIDIVWETLEFEYDKGNQGQWNPDQHEFDATTSKGWDGTEATVKVINHSNAEIKVKASFTDDAVTVNKNNVDITLSDSTGTPANTFVTLENDVVSGATLDDCPKRIFTVSVDENDEPDIAEGTINATIMTVTVSKAM